MVRAKFSARFIITSPKIFKERNKEQSKASFQGGLGRILERIAKHYTTTVLRNTMPVPGFNGRSGVSLL